MTAMVAAVLAASVGPVAFPAPGGFLILSRSGELLHKVTTLGGLAPESLAVSPTNSKLYVFTAKREGQPQAAMYKYEEGAAEAHILGRGVGFHAQPSFTNDGQWVFFIHHPTKDGGPPGMHATREYGQLWRIRIDGSGLEQMTKTKGCKLYPDARDSTHVVFTHADCGDQSGVEQFEDGRTRVVTDTSAARAHLPRRSPDGSEFALARLQGDNIVLELCPKARVCTRLAVLPRSAEPTSLEWLGDGKALVVALGPSLLKVDVPTGTATELFNLLEVSP